MARRETNEIIGQITDATVHLVNVNVDLVQRIARSDATAEPDEATGPVQQIWMSCAESAGDLVQISYLTAQLVDSLWASRRATPETD
ncbi:MAG TPA: hypothetical protein VK277_03345 [Acidimicrobiales bacterium]|nr:hypothetical protein [Acidimicrobiales bacterium]